MLLCEVARYEAQVANARRMSYNWPADLDFKTIKSHGGVNGKEYKSCFVKRRNNIIV